MVWPTTFCFVLGLASLAFGEEESSILVDSEQDSQYPCPLSDACGFNDNPNRFWVRPVEPALRCWSFCVASQWVALISAWLNFECGRCELVNPPTEQPTENLPTEQPTESPVVEPIRPSAQPSAPPTQTPDVTATSFRVLETLPHDSQAFTQGLVYLEDGRMYEGTGLRGRSSIRIVDLETGIVQKQHNLADEYFGEGVAHYFDSNNQERLIQLTWQLRTGFIYDAELNLLEEFSFSTTNNEGWGITYVPTMNRFIVSDGSSYLHWWDVETRQEISKVQVLDTNGRALTRMNELEWDPYTETVLANVWLTNRIVRINPVTGKLVRSYDMTSLYVGRPSSADVLNGIALTNATDEFYITGKLWPLMFRVQLIDM